MNSRKKTQTKSRAKTVTARRTQTQLNASMHTLVQLEKSQIRALMPELRDKTPMLSARMRIHTFNRTLPASTLIQTTADTFGAISFSLGSLTNSTEFTSLFDAYRIIEAVVTFIPSYGSITAPLYTIIDYDDANAPAAITDMLQYGQVLQISEPGTLTTRCLSPSTNIVGGGNFRAPKSTWIDVGTPAVQYFGIKWGLPFNPGPPNGTVLYVLVTRLSFQCRETR